MFQFHFTSVTIKTSRWQWIYLSHAIHRIDVSATQNYLHVLFPHSSTTNTTGEVSKSVHFIRKVYIVSQKIESKWFFQCKQVDEEDFTETKAGNVFDKLLHSDKTIPLKWCTFNVTRRKCGCEFQCSFYICIEMHCTCSEKFAPTSVNNRYKFTKLKQWTKWFHQFLAFLALTFSVYFVS